MRLRITSIHANELRSRSIIARRQFENDNSAISNLLKALKRTMAGEYSRELSVKVSAGQRRLVAMVLVVSPPRQPSNKFNAYPAASSDKAAEMRELLSSASMFPNDELVPQRSYKPCLARLKT